MKDCHAFKPAYNKQTGLADKAAGREKLRQVISI